MGSVDDYEVSYTYVKNTSGINTIRVDQITMPSGNVLTCKYRGNTSDRHDTFLSRLTTLDDGATVLVAYEYLGMGRVVGTDYYDVDIESDVHGTTSGSYPGLDRFNRVTTKQWTRDLGTDFNFYEVDISYDEASNITLVEDNLHAGFDVEYTLDALNRLTQAEEGTWSGSAITSKTRLQRWTLDHVGNLDADKLDLDGDGNLTGTGEHDDDRTHNDVNELTARDTDDDGTDDLTLSYDEVGNLTDDGEDYKYTWDAFGRLRKVLDRSDDSLVAEYRYNGLNYRISVHADTDTDGDVDGDDKWYHSAYNPNWQELTVFREDDTDPKKEFVYHLAGLDGMGGSSYPDLVVLRFRDADTAWTAASDGTLEEKVYYCQNSRADVSVLVEQTGTDVEMKEWARYSAYGVPFGLPGGDTDSDGDCDATDVSQVQTWINGLTYDVRADIDLDGLVDSSDKGTIDNDFEGLTLGHGALSASSVENERGSGGHPMAAVADLLHARRRGGLPTLGRWNSRDPLVYVDGPSLYQQFNSAPHQGFDPFGMATVGVAMAAMLPSGAGAPPSSTSPRQRPCGQQVVRDMPRTSTCDNIADLSGLADVRLHINVPNNPALWRPSSGSCVSQEDCRFNGAFTLELQTSCSDCSEEWVRPNGHTTWTTYGLDFCYAWHGVAQFGPPIPGSQHPPGCRRGPGPRWITHELAWPNQEIRLDGVNNYDPDNGNSTHGVQVGNVGVNTGVGGNEFRASCGRYHGVRWRMRTVLINLCQAEATLRLDCNRCNLFP